jgi:TolB protein
LGQEVAWSFTVSYPRLVYLYPADGRANLYALDPLTGQRQQITDSAGGIVDFDVNAKGSRVYYSIKNNAGGSDIYRLDLQSNNLAASQETKTPAPDVPKLVLDCAQASCRSPRLSPGEDYLAYERTAEVGSSDPAYPQVWLLPLTADGGRGQGQAIRPGEADHQTLLPSWSPGGLLAFYDTSRSAFVLSDPKQGRQQFFPNQTGQAGYWESDNRHYTAPEISFVDLGSVEASSEMQPVANSHLMRFSWEDGSVQDLSQDENLEDTSPAYAPDGMTLAFARKYLDTSRWSPGRQIWLMRPDGSDARQITNEPLYNHFAFAWDPDGTHLAYVRFNQTIPNEPPEIWILELSSGRAGRWIIGGYSPQWIP